MSSNQKFESELHRLYQTNRNFVHQVLSYEFNVNFSVKDSNGNTILHKMISENDFKGADLLLDNLKKGIYSDDVKLSLLNTQNKQLNSPVHLAVLNGQQGIAKKLDRLGANLSLANEDDLVIRMTESETNSSSRHSSRGRKSVERATSVTSDSNTGSSNMKDILSNLLKPFIQNEKSNNQPTERINMNAPLNLTTVTSSDDKVEQVKRKKNIPNMPISNPINLTESADSDSAEKIKTSDFINFLKRKTNTQLGGSNADSQIIKGSRQLKKESKKVDSDVHSANAISASDSLGIGAILAEQTGGRKHKKGSKRLTSKLSSVSRSSSSRSSRSRSASRKNKPSSDVHFEVIELIKKLGYSEDDARYIKAGLYQQIKNDYPDLSNIQRAIRMKELTTSDVVKKIANHLPELKNLVMKAREQRKSEKESSEKPKAKKTSKEAKTTKESKEGKEPKASKETKAKKTTKASRSKGSKRHSKY
jgi:hypothetical protein